MPGIDDFLDREKDMDGRAFARRSGRRWGPK
jgi:hypothetical protein